MRVKYAFCDEEPRRRIARLVATMMPQMARHGNKGATIGWDSYQSSAAAEVAEIDEALFEVAQLLADLTRVDGTVLITDSLEVLGFGVEIAGELPEVAQVARARPGRQRPRMGAHRSRGDPTPLCLPVVPGTARRAGAGRLSGRKSSLHPLAR
jgi:hypothetical protein